MYKSWTNSPVTGSVWSQLGDLSGEYLTVLNKHSCNSFNVYWNNKRMLSLLVNDLLPAVCVKRTTWIESGMNFPLKSFPQVSVLLGKEHTAPMLPTQYKRTCHMNHSTITNPVGKYGHSLSIPHNAFYQAVFLSIALRVQHPGWFSCVWDLHRDLTPNHRPNNRQGDGVDSPIHV